LGTDFELVQLANASGTPVNSWGWTINVSGGSTDVQHVSGIENITQAIESRFRTERGSNVLYPAIGLPRLVGVKGAGETVIEARYEARRQLLADSRIQRIAALQFRQENDVLVLEADVQPKGFNTTRVISRTLT
jgi:phage baseplate assembly protein W